MQEQRPRLPWTLGSRAIGAVRQRDGRIVDLEPSEGTDEESEQELQHPASRREDARVVSDPQSLARRWEDQTVNGDQDAHWPDALAMD
jgi:hypothetical protein